MTVKYSILDPTGNITALVADEVEIGSQPYVASLIMKNEPAVEQVGFLDVKNRRMRMAGGEFCGNASMCAAVMCLEDGLQNGESSDILLDVSGAPEKVSVHIEKKADNSFYCGVDMPKAESVAVQTLTCGGTQYRLPAVKFAGISHIINECPAKSEQFAGEIKSWCRALGCDSLGIMNIDRPNGKIVPLVYVPASGTLFWENSCASGTAAAGVYYADKGKCPFEADFAEPGGTLGVKAEPDGSVAIKGTVRIVSLEKVINLN